MLILKTIVFEKKCVYYPDHTCFDPSSPILFPEFSIKSLSGLAHKPIDQCKYFSGLCRSLKFTTPVEGYTLVGHVIKNLSIGMHASCENLCTMESQCVSINIGPPINDKMVCELSNSDDKRHSEDLKTKEGFMYRATQVRNSNLVLGFLLTASPPPPPTTTPNVSICVCDRLFVYLTRTLVTVTLARIMAYV